MLLGGRHELAGSDGLAGLAHADPHLDLGRRSRAQVAVVGEDAVDVGSRHVERIGDELGGVGVDVAEGMLEGLQRDKDGPGLIAGSDHRPSGIGGPGLMGNGHVAAPWSMRSAPQ